MPFKPAFINVKFEWSGVGKKQGSSFHVGTSPAFELALYMVCFFAEPGDCTCSIGGDKVKILTVDFKNRGMVLTSYPKA